ncbi:MFS transporter [Spiractinospora alimapuensis]|uniref:MFS transporter n=1 Tax=Spiractinospora alimapuensis TaxID=2820884 RepID=UPI001F459A3A|nr:MFS transporter [Spiractinospora alimapuensis]QVQ51953.1 MFS transporter [Spiractinospora alimapuensis]
MTEVAQRRAIPRSLWAILGLFAIVMTLGGSDMTKVTVALPAIGEDLGLGPLQALWTADVYALTAGMMIIPAAVLADRFGRKRLYLIGLGIAISGAMVAGATSVPEMLLLARAGQGVGAAMLIAGTVAIIRVTFPGLRLRAVAYGVWSASFGVGSALGPLLGGGLVELAGWRWVFWINVVLFVLCVVLARAVLEESHNPDAPSLDVPSAVYSAVAVGLLVVGLKGAAQPDSTTALSAAAIVAGAVVGVVFLARQLRLARPFLDVRLFTNRLLAASTATIAATTGIFNGVLYVLTQRLQIIDEQSAVEAGITLVPLAAACAVGGLLGPALQRGLSPQHVIVTGLALASGGALFVMNGATQTVAMVLLGLGAGIVMAIAANALMSAAPHHRTADAGAIQESAFAVGAGAGIATVGALAIFLGTRETARMSLTAIYGPGAEAAIGLGAFLYTFVAIGAGLTILSTSREDLNA